MDNIQAIVVHHDWSFSGNIYGYRHPVVAKEEVVKITLKRSRKDGLGLLWVLVVVAGLCIVALGIVVALKGAGNIQQPPEQTPHDQGVDINDVAMPDYRIANLAVNTKARNYDGLRLAGMGVGEIVERSTNFVDWIVAPITWQKVQEHLNEIRLGKPTENRMEFYRLKR